MVEFGGWSMPLQYTSILQEHHAVRNHCGLFDISHMGEVRVTGEAAESFLNELLTNDAGKLAAGQAHYSLMCNERGGVIDDLYAYRLASNVFLLVINASHIDKDVSWMQSQQSRWLAGNPGRDLDIENVSDKTSALALQGPNAAGLLDGVIADISKRLPRNRIAKLNLLRHDVFVARTGYTGEDGFELIMFNDAVLSIWQKLVERGAMPCGLGARDTLRLEMCYPLHGNDLTEDTTPLEAGLGFFVALDKPSFVGKEILQRQKQVGTEKRLVAFTMKDRGAIPRQHYKLLRGDAPVGEVTSGSMSPSLQIGVGMGYVQTKYAKVNEPLQVEIRGRNAPAVIVKKPFYKPKNA